MPQYQEIDYTKPVNEIQQGHSLHYWMREREKQEAQALPPQNNFGSSGTFVLIIMLLFLLARVKGIGGRVKE
jgi:hypothetical protein